MATGRESVAAGARNALALLAALALIFGSAGAADGPPLSAERIHELLQALESPQRAERAGAEQSLLDAGPAILELLPPMELVESAATREALRRIRVELELEAAQLSVQPSRVTLSGAMAFRQAAVGLSSQTGNPVSVERLPIEAQDKMLELRLEGINFWRAVGALAEAGGVDWMIDGEDGGVEFVPAEDAPRRVSFSASTAYAVIAESVRVRGDTVRIQFQIAAEPRLRPLFVQIADADFVAVREGESLPLFSPQARTELPMTSRAPARFAVHFRRPESLQAGDPLVVRGKVGVHTAAAPTDVRFEDLTARGRIARRRGGVTVTLERVRWLPSPEGQGARIAMSVAYDAGGPEFESHRTWIYHNEVYLEDPEGGRYPVNDGFDTTAQANGGAALEYRFKALPAHAPSEWQFVYVAPTLLVDVPVEFEFPMLRAGGGEE